ncbi:hypothetical protein JCM16303_002445 [Sporobolomyces ruberrimus]
MPAKLPVTPAQLEIAYKFIHLRQTGSALSYSIKFKELEAKLVREAFLIVLFIEGLKEEIQLEFARIDIPDTLEGCMAYAIRMDSRHRACKAERRRERRARKRRTGARQ